MDEMTPTVKIRYAQSLGIDLPSRTEKELFKWFLACLLFGKPIQTEIAEKAYKELVAAGLASPESILHAGWNKLVAVLDRAHYVRYDFSTATKLLEVCRELKRRYGTVSNLLKQAKNAGELSQKLQDFKHIGPVTARIFVREIRPIWYSRAVVSSRHRRRTVLPVNIVCLKTQGSGGPLSGRKSEAPHY